MTLFTMLHVTFIYFLTFLAAYGSRHRHLSLKMNSDCTFLCILFEDGLLPGFHLISLFFSVCFESACI